MYELVALRLVLFNNRGVRMENNGVRIFADCVAVQVWWWAVKMPCGTHSICE